MVLGSIGLELGRKSLNGRLRSTKTPQKEPLTVILTVVASND